MAHQPWSSLVRGAKVASRHRRRSILAAAKHSLVCDRSATASTNDLSATLSATFVPQFRTAGLAQTTHALLRLPDPRRHHGARRPSRTRACSALAPWAAAEDLKVLRNLTAAYELIRRCRPHAHERRPTASTASRRQPRGGRARGAADVTPFGTLLRFRRTWTIAAAARAGGRAAVRALRHAAAQTRCKTLLPDHDVYITDWHNARDVRSATAGSASTSTSQHLIDSWRRSGAGAHVVAVCQPCVQVLTAAAVMAAGRQPRTAAQHDADGRPDRHAHQPDQGQRARHREADRVVRAEPDRARAVALSRARGAARLSGLRAALRLHVA